MRTAHIQVFITGNLKFRARIKPLNETVAYEVTVGSEQWSIGKGREYQKEIKQKCDEMIKALQEQYWQLSRQVEAGKKEYPVTNSVGLPPVSAYKNLNYTKEDLGFQRKWKGRYAVRKEDKVKFLIVHADPQGVGIRKGNDEVIRMNYSTLCLNFFIH